MDYEIINSIGKIREELGKWEEFVIDDYKAIDLYKIYSIVKVNIRNKALDEEGCVDLADYLEEYNKTGKTFINWLNNRGDKALNFTENEIFKLRKDLGLIYKEALTANFNIKPVRPGLLPDKHLSGKKDYTDLFITKKDINPITMYHHTLISVNGYFHPTDANSQGLWVSGGFNTIKKGNRICIGIVSFENIGKLKQIPITEDMLDRFNDSIPYSKELIIDIGEDITDKTVILIIGGYLHVLDYDVFFRISDTAIKVNVSNIPLLERIHQCMDTLDVEDIAIDETRGERNVNFKDLYSDDIIKKYFTLPYSFIVLLDNVNVFKEVSYPQQRHIPNNYLMDEIPRLPMFSRLGKIEEYIWTRDYDKFILETYDCQYNNRQYNRSFPLEEDSIQSDGRVPGRRLERPYCYFFNLLSHLEYKIEDVKDGSDDVYITDDYCTCTCDCNCPRCTQHRAIP